jgi:acyl-CoA thioesterase II
MVRAVPPPRAAGLPHESTFAGAGMACVRGQVLTADGRLLTSFTQDAVIRALASPAASVPTSSRL